MNCETARERLLETDLSSLEGEGDLALHLQSCEACRTKAQVILDQYAALRRTLDRQVSRLDLTDPRWQRPLPRPPTWRRWPVALPLALAASLAILIVARRNKSILEPGTSVSMVASAGAELDVQGPRGKTVAVFQTDNPNIVVIWSF